MIVKKTIKGYKLQNKSLVSIKGVRSQGEGCLSSAVIQMRTSALFGAKKHRLFEIYGVSARAQA